MRMLGMWMAFTCAALAVVQVAEASPLVKASSSSNLGSSPPQQQATSGSVSNIAGGTDNGLASSGSSQASFGVVRATAGASAGGVYRSLYSAFAFNNASFRDDFLIDAPGLTGTAGSVTVRFTLDGSIGVNKSGQAQYAIQHGSSTQVSYFFGQDATSGPFYTLRGDDEVNGANFLGTTQEATLNFIFGQPIANVTLGVNANATANAEYDYAFSGNASLRATWDGFVAVRDANGNLLTRGAAGAIAADRSESVRANLVGGTYSFSSASGFDYTVPAVVPEPATLAAAISLGAATLLRRRRR